jgi:hypothetical protein
MGVLLFIIVLSSKTAMSKEKYKYGSCAAKMKILNNTPRNTG